MVPWIVVWTFSWREGDVCHSNLMGLVRGLEGLLLGLILTWNMLPKSRNAAVWQSSQRSVVTSFCFLRPPFCIFFVCPSTRFWVLIFPRTSFRTLSGIALRNAAPGAAWAKVSTWREILPLLIKLCIWTFAGCPLEPLVLHDICRPKCAARSVTCINMHLKSVPNVPVVLLP